MTRTIMTVLLTLSGAAVFAKDLPSKISRAQAEKTVKQRYADAKIKDSELEKEDGKVIWSFDLKTGGKTREVWVDADNGAVVKDVVETPATEADEMILDKAEALVKAHVHGEILHGELRVENGVSVAAFAVKTKDGKTRNVVVDVKTNKMIDEPGAK